MQVHFRRCKCIFADANDAISISISNSSSSSNSNSNSNYSCSSNVSGSPNISCRWRVNCNCIFSIQLHRRASKCMPAPRRMGHAGRAVGPAPLAPGGRGAIAPAADDRTGA